MRLTEESSELRRCRSIFIIRQNNRTQIMFLSEYNNSHDTDEHTEIRLKKENNNTFSIRTSYDLLQRKPQACGS